jgi:hypothetical protein
MPAGVKNAATTPDSLFRRWTGPIAGSEYTFQEVSVKDNDAAVNAARNEDGTFDGRIMMRLLVIKCSVEPKLTEEALQALPQRVYLQICDVVNDLNVTEEPDEEDLEKND